jgi:hypothetical protein
MLISAEGTRSALVNVQWFARAMSEPLEARQALTPAATGIRKCCSMLAGRLQAEIGKKYAFVPYRSVWMDDVE